MVLEKQRQAYCHICQFMRIKAHGTGENKELNYQIKAAKIILQDFRIDFSGLEY